MIIIGNIYFDESVFPTNAISTNGDILSHKVGVHWVYIHQSTFESIIFEGFIIYPFVHVNSFYKRIAYLSFDSRHEESVSISILGG